MIPAATRYDVTTHAISSTLAEKLPCICGSETLTIELSRTSSTVPSITENAIIHLRVEVNSCTSWICAGAGLGVALIADLRPYATKGAIRMQRTGMRDAVIGQRSGARGVPRWPHENPMALRAANASIEASDPNQMPTALRLRP